jgi:SAM-dependent methyltransferase
VTGGSTLDLKSGARPDWTVVDDGWGRRAADIATLSEPGNCREYVAIHHRLGVGEGDRLLDVACGAALAIALALVRGAGCCGIDAAPRLAAVARDRNPDADLRVGDGPCTRPGRCANAAVHTFGGAPIRTTHL